MAVPDRELSQEHSPGKAMLILLVVSILFAYGAVAADDPPASPDPTPVDPAAPVSPTPAASARPDFAAVKKQLVIVRDASENAAPGFSIGDQGHIVTAAGRLADQASYQVATTEGQMFSADRLAADDKTGLLILRLSDSGHGVTGLTFARTALRAAAPLHAVNFNPSGSDFSLLPGTVTQLITDDGSQFVTHNALFSLASAGTPLLNRCFQAVGVNVLEKEGWFGGREVDPTRKGSARSLAAASLGSLLASLNLSLPVAAAECLSLEEERQQEQEQARQAQEAARQREAAAAVQRQLEEAQRREETLQRDKEAAEERARRMEADKRRAEQEAQRQLEQHEQDTQAELQRQRDEARRREAALQREKDDALRREQEKADQRQRHILFIGSGIGGLALLGVVLLMRRKQKRLRTTEQEKQHISDALGRTQSELSEAAARDRLRDSAPDVFLESRSPPIALKIPGASLVDQPGAIVGRSPSESTCVISHEQISRRHFRLCWVSQQLTVEDLGSTNGTSVNGALLEPGQQTPVNDGSRVLLGDLELTLHIGR